MTPEEIITKYRMKLIERNGQVGFMPEYLLDEQKKQFEKDRPEITKVKEEIKQILLAKKKREETEYKEYQAKLAAGTLEIEVRRVTHFVGALDEEITENLVYMDSRVFHDIGMSLNVTKMAPGKYSISELPEWQSWTEKHKMKDAKEAYIKASGKVLVHLNRCWECGVMKVVGGSEGKLPYEQYRKAREELSGMVRKQLANIPEGEILNSVPEPSRENGPFDFESQHFIYQVVSREYDGC